MSSISFQTQCQGAGLSRGWGDQAKKVVGSNPNVHSLADRHPWASYPNTLVFLNIMSAKNLFWMKVFTKSKPNTILIFLLIYLYCFVWSQLSTSFCPHSTSTVCATCVTSLPVISVYVIYAANPISNTRLHSIGWIKTNWPTSHNDFSSHVFDSRMHKHRKESGVSKEDTEDRVTRVLFFVHLILQTNFYRKFQMKRSTK